MSPDHSEVYMVTDAMLVAEIIQFHPHQTLNPKPYIFLTPNPVPETRNPKHVPLTLDLKP